MVLYEVKGFRSNDYICLSKLSSLIEPIAFLQAFCTCQKKNLVLSSTNSLSEFYVVNTSAKVITKETMVCLKLNGSD